MDFSIDHADGRAAIQLRGRLTFQESAWFRQVIEGIGDPAMAVELNLAAVDFIDSAGLGMLLVLRESLSGPVTLVTAGGQVARMLNLACFSDFFQLSDIS